ncbi:Predicted arabinose efflux permease, MFS family [Mucilaginibacter pineti]|uniref:Predicted arabinose efflux permease, MFS family n=1 Tax=Mucilaginibacter pineti TaxID=1391627 RepID=A0A1G6U2U1_9SPHI|nr:MFS transporter [Mucilaginibacter pineti]SDD35623.1 Predicted arabinose efflux permease, MFS family [Mucilaginibacter pineti]
MKKSIYIMALGAFGIITTEFGVIGILPMIARDMNISIETAGWLLSGFALTIALTGPFTVLATASVNRRTMMSLVLFIFVISNILSAVSHSFTMLMVARILPAILHPVFWSVATVAAAKQVEPKDAPKAISVVLAGLSTATVLGVPLTTYVADLAGWRYAFVVSGVINLVACIALLTMVPSMPVKEKPSVKKQLKALNSKQLWLNLTATMLMIAGMFSSYSYLAEFLEKITHMNGAQVSLMLLVFGGAGIAGNWLTGIALSKNVLLTARTFILSLAAVHVMAYIFGGWFGPMAGILAIWGFIHTGGFLIGQIRTTTEAPDALELASSLMVSFGNAGVTLGTMLGGVAIAAWGVHELVWMSIPLLGSAYLLTFVRFADAKSTEAVPLEAMQLH